MNVVGYFNRFCNAGLYLLSLAGAGHGQVIERGLGLGTISNTIRYFDEVVHNDGVLVTSAIFQLGRTSIHYGHKMLNARTGTLCATATFSEVLFGLESRSSTP